MMTRALYRIQETLGLTHVEAMAALVLGVALISGSIADWALTYSDESDYSEADAAFAALVSARDTQSGRDRSIQSIGLINPADSVGANGDSTASEANGTEKQTQARPTPVARPAPHSININTATAGELTRLPGIGPVLAARIVENRSTQGSFHNASDLIRVKGIGEKTFQKMEPHVAL